MVDRFHQDDDSSGHSTRLSIRFEGPINVEGLQWTVLHRSIGGARVPLGNRAGWEQEPLVPSQEGNWPGHLGLASPHEATMRLDWTSMPASSNLELDEP